MPPLFHRCRLPDNVVYELQQGDTVAFGNNHHAFEFQPRFETSSSSNAASGGGSSSEAMEEIKQMRATAAMAAIENAKRDNMMADTMETLEQAIAHSKELAEQHDREMQKQQELMAKRDKRERKLKKRIEAAKAEVGDVAAMAEIAQSALAEQAEAGMQEALARQRSAHAQESRKEIAKVKAKVKREVEQSTAMSRKLKDATDHLKRLTHEKQLARQAQLQSQQERVVARRKVEAQEKQIQSLRKMRLSDSTTMQQMQVEHDAIAAYAAEANQLATEKEAEADRVKRQLESTRDECKMTLMAEWATHHKLQQVVVVDTNVWMHEFDTIIRAWNALNWKNGGKIGMLIPHAVTQELDRLKSSRDHQTQQKSRRASSTIGALIANKPPSRIKLPIMAQSQENRAWIRQHKRGLNLSNDDEIYFCWDTFRERVALKGCEVNLISRDNNMFIQASAKKDINCTNLFRNAQQWQDWHEL